MESLRAGESGRRLTVKVVETEGLYFCLHDYSIN